MITEKNHKLLTSQIFLTDCTKKGLASMGESKNIRNKFLFAIFLINYLDRLRNIFCAKFLKNYFNQSGHSKPNKKIYMDSFL
jgi:hypothetical protein